MKNSAVDLLVRFYSELVLAPESIELPDVPVGVPFFAPVKNGEGLWVRLVFGPSPTFCSMTARLSLYAPDEAGKNTRELDGKIYCEFGARDIEPMYECDSYSTITFFPLSEASSNVTRRHKAICIDEEIKRYMGMDLSPKCLN